MEKNRQTGTQCYNQNCRNCERNQRKNYRANKNSSLGIGHVPGSDNCGGKTKNHNACNNLTDNSYYTKFACLLGGKKAYLVVATGGVPVGSPVDFATPYLRHALSFIGIDDVEIIAAEKLNVDADEAFDTARARIAELVHLTAAA